MNPGFTLHRHGQCKSHQVSKPSLRRYIDYATGILVTLNFILAPLEGIESKV